MQTIRIEHFELGLSMTSPAEMARLAGASFSISDRVPETAGEAFDWHSWHSGWLRQAGAAETAGAPTHLIVEAADAFEASIPWEQLKHAAVLYQLDGEPLKKTGPIRLYVPNGCSKCLNVKSIVKLKLAYHKGTEQEEAAFGFKHTFSAEDLRKNR
ncbi:hypothetical protein [Paenibacillus sp. FJAT-27812]|uniref:hypothetical protein n=1 Tax=Paenibacillus sp. FJAT-27812 TaxID=1684143 RepID=UPI0006A7DF3D|nr:hypothetical protein [Paenibacillus sp. FJAT-27812]